MALPGGGGGLFFMVSFFFDKIGSRVFGGRKNEGYWKIN